jgi:hypothetical protein
MSTAALTLYELETELTTWIDTLPLVEGDEVATAEIQTKITEYLTKAASKRDRVAQFLAHLESLEELSKAEEIRLAKRRETLKVKRERLEWYIVNTLRSLNLRKLEGNTSTLKLVRNPDSVVITDFDAIPDEFLVRHLPPAPTADKRAIREAIRAGEVVPGADLRPGADRLERK